MTTKKKIKKKRSCKYFLLLLLIVLLIPKARATLIAWVKPVIFSLKNLGSHSARFDWENVGVGIEMSTMTLKRPNIAFNTDLFLLRIDPKFIATKVIYAKKLTTAQNIVESTGAVAAINASFFDPQGRPLGLLVHEGLMIQRIPQTGMFNSGVFCLQSNYPFILHRSAFKMDGVKEAIQSMPRLLHDGMIISQIKNKDEKKRRSGIAVDYNGKIIIYITDTHLGGLSFDDLQKFLISSNLNIRSALNLDGGRSSQLYLNYNNRNKNIVGLSEVPVFLAFYKNWSSL